MTRLSITHEQCVKGRVKDHAWRLNRACKCGAPIPYEAHKHTKLCAYCKQTRHARAYRAKHPEARTYGKRDEFSCKRCGAHAGGKTLCKACRDKHVKGIAYMKAKRLSVGLCAYCGIEPLQTTTRGPLCAAKERAYQRQYRDIAIASGKCGRCRKRPQEDGSTHCTTCKRVKRAQNAKAPPRKRT